MFWWKMNKIKIYPDTHGNLCKQDSLLSCSAESHVLMAQGNLIMTRYLPWLTSGLANFGKSTRLINLTLKYSFIIGLTLCCEWLIYRADWRDCHCTGLVHLNVKIRNDEMMWQTDTHTRTQPFIVKDGNAIKFFGDEALRKLIHYDLFKGI